MSLRRDKNTTTDFQLPEKIKTGLIVKLLGLEITSVSIFCNSHMFSVSEKEQAAYDAISTAITDYTSYLETIAADAFMSNTQSVLALITRLRQACLDLSLVPVDALVKILAATDQPVHG